MASVFEGLLGGAGKGFGGSGKILGGIGKGLDFALVKPFTIRRQKKKAQARELTQSRERARAKFGQLTQAQEAPKTRPLGTTLGITAGQEAEEEPLVPQLLDQQRQDEQAALFQPPETTSTAEDDLEEIKKRELLQRVLQNFRLG